ncbi:MAG: hypothetical protein JWM90_203 [Thermoleophilia bacterium]|nr:hypothetical protein [Thermoleophilia bacterium]
MESELARIIVTRADAVEQVDLQPAPMLIHTDGAALGGRLAVMETTLPPRSDGPPPHLHRDVVEVFHVIDGMLRVHVGSAHVDLTAGGTVAVPTGVPHTYSNPHDVPVRLLIVVSSDVIPRLFRQLQQLSRDASGNADPTEIEALMAAHDSFPPELA